MQTICNLNRLNPHVSCQASSTLRSIVVFIPQHIFIHVVLHLPLLFLPDVAPRSLGNFSLPCNENLHLPAFASLPGMLICYGNSQLGIQPFHTSSRFLSPLLEVRLEPVLCQSDPCHLLIMTNCPFHFFLSCFCPSCLRHGIVKTEIIMRD